MILRRDGPDRLTGDWSSPTPGCSEGRIEVVRSDICTLANKVAARAGTPNDRAALAQEYIKLLDARRELARQREQFLGPDPEHPVNRPDWSALFGTLYFHTLDQMEARVQAGRATNLHELVFTNRFYDAWATNLRAYRRAHDVAAVEPHWRPYFEQAKGLTDGKPEKDGIGAHMILAEHGVNAHIKGDLPRAVRAVYQPLGTTARDSFSRAFTSSEELFAPVQEAFERDLLNYYTRFNASDGGRGEASLGAVFTAGDWFGLTPKPIPLRRNSWKVGTDMRSPLPTSTPQPAERAPSVNCPRSVR